MLNNNYTCINLEVDCPEGFFHLYNDTKEECVCYEDNTAYFGNNHRFGAENPQLSRLSCQNSCESHPECIFGPLVNQKLMEKKDFAIWRQREKTWNSIWRTLSPEQKLSFTRMASRIRRLEIIKWKYKYIKL